MVGAFPVAKLAYLAIRQLGKPVANFLKERAKSSKFFRDYICMPPAQLHHWYDTRLKMQALGLGKPKNVTRLNEEQAVDTGATILGEAVIYTIGALTMYIEYRRQGNKEQAKEGLQNDTLAELTRTTRELTLMTEAQEAKLRELERLLHTKADAKK